MNPSLRPATTIPTVEPVTQKYLDDLAALKLPPIYTLSPADARAALAGAQQVEVALLPAEISERTIPVGPTGQTRLRTIRPLDVKESLPAIMFFHGGGWMLGGVDTHDRLVRELAVGVRATVVFVDYDLAPEAQYPIANEQAYAATRYVAEHAGEFRVDAGRLAVVGDSAGGNMATVVALMAKQRGGPNIVSQVLFYPVTAADFDNASYQQFADGPWLTRTAMKWFWDAYLPDVAARRQPTASPLEASLEQLSGLPPALIITDENDVLREEGEAYAHKLAQAGVSVAAVRYLGTIHDFVMLNAITDAPAPRSAIALAIDTLRRAFAG